MANHRSKLLLYYLTELSIPFNPIRSIHAEARRQFAGADNNALYTYCKRARIILRKEKKP